MILVPKRLVQRAPVNEAGRKLDQGFSAELQYAALNKARAKRKRRAERNWKEMLSGGHNIPLINANSDSSHK